MIKYGMVLAVFLSPYLYANSTSGYFCAGSLSVNSNDNDYFISIAFLDNDKGEINVEEVNQKPVISHSLNFNYVKASDNKSGVIHIVNEGSDQCLSYNEFPLNSFNNCTSNKDTFLSYQRLSNSLRLNTKSGTFFICSPLP